MTISDDEDHPKEASLFWIREYSFPHTFMFCVFDSCVQNLPVSIGSYTYNYGKNFVDVLNPISHSELLSL